MAIVKMKFVSLQLQFALLLATVHYTVAFAPALTPSKQPWMESRPRSTTCLPAGWYGRGSDIWPPTNVDFPVRLEDSFPEGKVPPIAQHVRDGGDHVTKAAVHLTQQRGFRWIKFMGLTIALAMKEFIGPMDIGAVLLWSFYNYVLIKLADSANGLAAVPPAGHIPHFVRNPLQLPLQKKGLVGWDTWFSFALPSMLFFLGMARIESSTLSRNWWRVALGRPILWWMTTQIADDALAINNSPENSSPVPLPIQYWIRLSSRLVRWSLLTVAVVVTQWPSLITSGDAGGRTSVLSCIFGILPAFHWVWSTCQVFGFWIPIAGMRYMRAHMISAEAETFTVQPTAAHHYTILSPLYPSAKN